VGANAASARLPCWKVGPTTATTTCRMPSGRRAMSFRFASRAAIPIGWCWIFDHRITRRQNMRYRNNPAAVSALVRPTEVHKDLFIDDEIFELEMEHLFANTWVYVGHASQVPNVGDFYTTTIGDQPVIMVRHSDQTVRVLHNRCPHKGVMVAGDI